jgi:hypothetical protein
LSCCSAACTTWPSELARRRIGQFAFGDAVAQIPGDREAEIFLGVPHGLRYRLVEPLPVAATQRRHGLETKRHIVAGQVVVFGEALQRGADAGRGPHGFKLLVGGA